jgi:hypothetical protein
LSATLKFYDILCGRQGHSRSCTRTILHRFMLSTRHIERGSLEHVSELHSLLGNQHPPAIDRINEVVDVELDFQARFADLTVENWASGDKDITLELDKHGDTYLIAILKMWPPGGSRLTLNKLIDQLTDRDFQCQRQRVRPRGKHRPSRSHSKRVVFSSCTAT